MYPSTDSTDVSALQCSLGFPNVSTLQCAVPALSSPQNTKRPLFYFYFSPVTLAVYVIQLLRILHQFSVFFKFLFAHLFEAEKFLLCKPADLCSQIFFSEV